MTKNDILGFMKAIEEKDLQKVKEYISKDKSFVNAHNGATPNVRYREILKILIDAGADIFEKNDGGKNAIDFIKMWGMEEYKLI